MLTEFQNYIALFVQISISGCIKQKEERYFEVKIWLFAGGLTGILNREPDAPTGAHKGGFTGVKYHEIFEDSTIIFGLKGIIIKIKVPATIF